MTVAELIEELKKYPPELPVTRHDATWGPEPVEGDDVIPADELTPTHLQPRYVEIF